MRKLGAEVVAGITIFLAFVTFVVGYLYLKDVRIKGGRYTVVVEFDDVTGLEQSDPVRLSGMQIGRVQDLQLSNFQVRALLDINRDVQLPVDSQAKIQSVGMVGEKYVRLIPGNAGQMLEEGGVIQGTNAGDFTEMASTADSLMIQVRSLIAEIRQILTPQMRQNIQETMTHMRSLSSALDAQAQENAAHLNNVLANLNRISTNLNTLLVDRKEALQTSIDSFHRASESLPTIADKLDSSLTSMQRLLNKIEHQEGTLGKVIANDALYNDLHHLTSELDTLVQDLKRRPQKYLNLGFIKIF